jgi:organic hydroperoxide reductase OsmC/OhrA
MLCPNRQGRNGNLITGSGVLSHTPYSFNIRFESDPGTNPNEPIAAAHSGCFTSALTLTASIPGTDKAGYIGRQRREGLTGLEAYESGDYIGRQLALG